MAKVDVDRAELKAISLDDGGLETRDQLAGARARTQVEPQPPRAPRLVDGLEAVEASLRGAHRARERLGRAAVGTTQLLRLVSADPRARPPRRDRLRPALALLDVALPCAAVGVAARRASALELGPAARVLARPARLGLELEHARDGPLQERAVVRDDDGARGEIVEEALEEREAGEVEVVGRLVQEEDVEAGEQDRRQGSSRRLTARHPRNRHVEPRRVQPDVCHDRARPRRQVGAAECEVPLERVVVVVRQIRLGAEAIGEGVHLGRRCGHARAAREIAEQRLAGLGVRLLRQVADGKGRRRSRDGPAVRLVEPREHA